MLRSILSILAFECIPSSYVPLKLSLNDSRVSKFSLVCFNGSSTRKEIQHKRNYVFFQLPGWKADPMTRAGRRVQVQSVLTGMLIYLAVAFDFPPWAIKAVDKIRRGFLWRGRKDAKGGHCLVAWVKVYHPPEHGGLEISDLKSLGWSLRMR